MRSSMGQLLQVVKSIPTMGKDSQSFIGAKWLIPIAFNICALKERTVIARPAV